MKNKDYEVFRYLSMAGQVGSTLLVSLLLGVFLGIYLDKYLHTAPVFTVGLSFFGIFTGLRTVCKLLSPVEEKEEKEEKTDKEKEEKTDK